MSDFNVVQIKDSKDKLFYEIDWSFVKKMAERMALNKNNKYPVFNWKNGNNVEELKQAITRHFIEIQDKNYSDEQLYGHFVALACNSMMIVYQLEHSQKELV